MKRQVIVRNEIMCLRCGEYITSTHRHDFRSCGCGAVCVDGGHEYLRRTWDAKVAEEMGRKPYEDTSEVVETEDER